MDELQIFENPDFGAIRTIEVDGEPWLVGKDVAAALGYSDTAQAVRTHVDEEDKGVVEMTTPGGKQKLQIINESGLYSLILSSKLPGAKKFKRWVTSEVLPSIRKSGGYMAPVAAKALDDMTAAIQLLSEQMEELSGQVGELLDREGGESVALAALPEVRRPAPGIAARRRWMRAVNEKLDLLSTKLSRSHASILHQVYKIMEKQYQISLDEERMNAIETYNLGDCSILAAIFYNEHLKVEFQELIDYNLAPENQGW
mgnify:CR=1 FL=1